MNVEELKKKSTKEIREIFECAIEDRQRITPETFGAILELIKHSETYRKMWNELHIKRKKSPEDSMTSEVNDEMILLRFPENIRRLFENPSASKNP